MREDISKILIKWGMPTRQAAIGEIIAYVNKLYGGCDLCYGKGYSTQAVSYNDESAGTKQPGEEILYCKCRRGQQLKKLLDKLRQTL